MDEINPYESPKQVSVGPMPGTGDDSLQESAATRAWHRQDFIFALAQQGVLLLFTSRVPDGGVLFGLYLAGVIALWAWMAIATMRRRTSPTALDIALVKYGFFFCFLLVFVVRFTLAAIMSLC
jgi:hypothetical protein